MHSSLSQLPQQAVGTASAPRRRLARLGGGRLCVRAGSEGSDSASQQARQVTYEQALEVRSRVQGCSRDASGCRTPRDAVSGYFDRLVAHPRLSRLRVSLWRPGRRTAAYKPIFC